MKTCHFVPLATLVVVLVFCCQAATSSSVDAFAASDSTSVFGSEPLDFGKSAFDKITEFFPAAVTTAATKNASATYLGKSCTPKSVLLNCGPYVCVPGPVAGNHVCAICTSDELCNDYSGGEVRICDLSSHQCHHKSLFPDFDWRDGIATTLISLVTLLASASGVGGGGMFIPILAFFGWGKKSIQLSLAAATGNSIGMVWFQVRTRHPKANRPAIDYKFMLMLQPIALIATVPGTLVHRVLPGVVLYAFVAFIFTFVGVTTTKKYIRERGKDKVAKASAGSGSSGSAAPMAAPGASTKSGSSMLVPLVDKSLEDGQDEGNGGVSSERDQILETEAKIPWLFVCGLFSCWVIVLALALLREEVVDCGSAGYIALNVMFIPAMLLFSIPSGFHLFRLHQRKVAVEYPFQKGDIQYSLRKVAFLVTVFFFTGLASASLGLGGAVILGPVLLSLDMFPICSSSITGLLSLMTTSSAIVQYLIMNTIPIDYTFWYMGFALVFSVCGRVGLQSYIKKKASGTVIILILAIVFITSSVLMIALEVKTAVEGVFDLLPLCG